MYNIAHKLHRKRCDEDAFHKMCNITHRLLVIGNNVMRLTLTKCEITHSLSVIGKDVIRLPLNHKMYSVTHKLAVIGKDIMRLPFTKFVMSLTDC